MDIGSKIKKLRYNAGLTQEQLADRLGLSPQAISKWETGSSMPDITLLPPLAEIFGTTIDELFDLSRDEKLQRIENRMDIEDELPTDVFRDYEDFLQEQLAKASDRRPILRVLARLYHHRMEADGRRVSRYAREAIRLAPDEKDCQWLLQKAEGAAAWDWNVNNHMKSIAFCKEMVALAPTSPLPYYYLLDNLLADHRAEEAEEYLRRLEQLPASRPWKTTVYRAYVHLARFDEAAADALMEQAKGQYEGDSLFLFEAAQYHARKCEYSKAIAYYEASFAAEENHKPRFTDALEAIAAIYETMGDYRQAADAWGRMITLLRDEWGFTGCVTMQTAEEERARLLQMV